MLEDILTALLEYHQVTKVDNHGLFVPFVAFNPNGSGVVYDNRANQMSRFENPEGCLAKLRDILEGARDGRK